MSEILIGLVSGVVSGMGMGGGTILILCLTIFLGMEQHIAQASNLIFFIPTCLIAIWINWKQKLINKRLAISVAISGVLGAFLGAFLAGKMDSRSLKRYFGIFLLCITINEIYSIVKKYIINKKRHNKIRIEKERST